LVVTFVLKAFSVFALGSAITIVLIGLPPKCTCVGGWAVPKAAASGGAILVSFALLHAVNHWWALLAILIAAPGEASKIDRASKMGNSVNTLSNKSYTEQAINGKIII
jgi:hypothetical protein